MNVLQAQGELQSIPGVGKGIAATIDELLSTGQVAEFEELYEQVPTGVVEMVRIPDVGPKTTASPLGGTRHNECCRVEGCCRGRKNPRIEGVRR